MLLIKIYFQFIKFPNLFLFHLSYTLTFNIPFLIFEFIIHRITKNIEKNY